VTEQVAARSMRAICAAFDGEFERLERLYAQRFERGHAAELGQAPPPPQDHPPQAPPIRAATPWEQSGPAHERIVRVGSAAVGLRHAPGIILVVW
jgi:hypothetical protein